MPPINEAENEDKDYPNDVKSPSINFNSGNAAVSRNADKSTTRAGADYTENNEGYNSTFQKDSEPGNK